MTRNNITVEMLISAGYEPFEFSDYTMEQGVEDIKNGYPVKLEPRYGGYMVAVVVKNGFSKEMCTRSMTTAEKEFYSEEMCRQESHYNKVSGRIHARNKARMRRR